MQLEYNVIETSFNNSWHTTENHRKAPLVSLLENPHTNNNKNCLIYSQAQGLLLTPY